MRRVSVLFFLLISCSPKVKPPDPESLKPAWLKNEPLQDGYYTGIGHSIKDGTNDYIQAAKKSALNDLASQIKVTVSGTSVLNQLEENNKLTEKYQEIIQTKATDEIEEFEMVDAYEDASNYWVYYRLSIARYREIKENQKRDATLLATDYYNKGKLAEKNGERLQAITFYFQAFRSLEKYLGEAIRVTINGQDLLLVNEVYASIQDALDKISIKVNPEEIKINRRLNQNAQAVTAKATYHDINKPAVNLPLFASFEKGSGDVFPDYKANESGSAKILINKIGSRDLEQTVTVKVGIDALSGGASSSPIYSLVTKTLAIPSAQVILKVQRPVVYMTIDEKSLGMQKTNYQFSDKLKNLLATAGFEFTGAEKTADLRFDITSDSEKGTVSGSIYITYVTSVIRVTAVKEGREVYATTLNRIKGYGLDYDKSSIDAYNKATDSLEKDIIPDLLNAVLQ